MSLSVGEAMPWAGSSRSRRHPVVLQRTEGQLFRERVGFIVICVIGAYCSMKILVELKSILEPFFWALFLLMAMKPLVDALEHRIESCLTSLCCLGRSDGKRPYTPVPLEEPVTSTQGIGGELQLFAANALEESVGRSLGGSSDEEEFSVPRVQAPREPSGLRSHDLASEDEDERSALRRTCSRGLAVLTVVAGALSVLYVFGFLILDSARHMQDHWDVYKTGAQNIARDAKGTFGVLFKNMPDSVKVRYEDVTTDVLKTAQDIIYGLLADLVNNISSLVFGGLLTMLYTLFWLCSPIPIDAAIDGMFRRFILFKTLACLGYGACVGLLLATLSVDLASVFALTTFALNYVPEVGPFVAAVLPIPIIILDSRLDRPFVTLVLSLAGQLALKFAFGNIIEVKLIESDKKLRMHPVMILLSVGIFGHIWGSTGMLLSVPLMALLKISLFSDLVPASYRDSILVLLEGDRDAPSRHGFRSQRSRSSEFSIGPATAPPGG